MIEIKPTDIPKPRLHQYILGGVAPRPIAFASTIDEKGIPNLSPFSFYNAFGINPTTLIFSPSRRGRDNTTKHTYENLKKVPEVVINAVSWEITEQMSLSSTEYPEGTNEFVKAGLTMVDSMMIRPYRVKESPIQFECKVREIVETGTGGGAGNLVISEILLIHLDENILDEKGMIDPEKARLVGRLGANYYCKAFGDALFEVEKPLQKLGIGIDQLPGAIRESTILTGNDLAKLANTERLPSEVELKEFLSRSEVKAWLAESGNDESSKHLKARELLEQGKTKDALNFLMLGL
jgi:flavin reductase (DIM6/NTAB) family NADH-FMN oxidoreductase RutF